MLGTNEYHPRFENSFMQKVYPDTACEHWIKSIMDSGMIIVLEDGSMWEISSLSLKYAKFWLPRSKIKVINNIENYSYKLLNINENQCVDAKYLGK